MSFLLGAPAARKRSRSLGPSLDFSDFVLAYGPLGYWRFDETSGSVAVDASGNGYDADYVNSPTLGQTSLLNSGDGSSIALNGSNQYVRVGSPADFSNLAALTVVLIVHPDNLSARRKYISKGPDVGGDASLYSWEMTQDQTTGNVRIIVSNGTNIDLFYHSTKSVGTAGPHLLAYGYDNSNVLASIDGDIETQARANSGQNSETGPLHIGRENHSGAGGDFYDGLMDEVAIFDRLLTPSEIGTLFEAFSSGPLAA